MEKLGDKGLGDNLPGYAINKGVGKPIEFNGLKGQYITFFVVGIVSVILLVIIMGVLGVPPLIPILLGAGVGGAVVFFSFRYNKVYGPYGLMKLRARGYHPHHLVSKKRVANILNTLKVNTRVKLQEKVQQLLEQYTTNKRSEEVFEVTDEGFLVLDEQK